MPLGEGYWINVYTNVKRTIDEHATDVSHHPEKYGLTKEDVAGLNPADMEEGRVEIAKKAMNNGWMRVRYLRGHCSFEFTARSRTALEAIHYFGERNFGPNTDLNINNLRTNEFIRLTWGEFQRQDPEEILRIAKFENILHLTQAELDKVEKIFKT